MMASEKTQNLWTPAFSLLCVVQFLGYAQHFVLQPTLPLYVTHFGGSPFIVGVVMAAFSSTSLVFRPLVGYWSDRWSEVGIMISGLAIQAASGIVCFLPFIATTALANSFRGVGWASFNSGGYALLAQAAPAERRGEASGYYTGVQNSATILLPALALWLIDAPFGGYRAVFALSVALALCGAAISFAIERRTVISERTRAAARTGPWWREILRLPEKDIVLASALLFGLHVSLPAMASFLVLYARQIGIENFGWYYVASGATSLIARPLLGWASDKIGRGAAVATGFTLEALALCLIVTASSLGAMMLSGVLYMLGSAIGAAATLALALERASPERRGQAVATYSMAYPLGAGIGSLLTGAAIQLVGYYWMFLFVAALNIPGMIVVYKYWSSLK